MYAANDFELRAKLEAIALPRPARSPRRANAEASPAKPTGDASPAATEASLGEEQAQEEPKASPSVLARKKKRDGALPATP